VNEKQVVEDEESGDLDIINNIDVDDDLDDIEFEYILTKRYSYSREYKLTAIDYFQII